jgi:hypothetical protein
VSSRFYKELEELSAKSLKSPKMIYASTLKEFNIAEDTDIEEIKR